MMSEDKSNFKPEWSFANSFIRKLNYVESWFDNHPEPWNIDMHIYQFDNNKIEVNVYFADQVFDTWMIKISCNTARRASEISKLFYKTTCQMNITQILNNKDLFLFTDRRF